MGKILDFKVGKYLAKHIWPGSSDQRERVSAWRRKGPNGTDTNCLRRTSAEGFSRADIRGSLRSCRGRWTAVRVSPHEPMAFHAVCVLLRVDVFWNRALLRLSSPKSASTSVVARLQSFFLQVFAPRTPNSTPSPFLYNPFFFSSGIFFPLCLSDFFGWQCGAIKAPVDGFEGHATRRSLWKICSAVA